MYVQHKDLCQCVAKAKNPFKGIPEIARFWKEVTATAKKFWEAPDRLYWICGKNAYVMLPEYWGGSCTLGAIKPSFFLLPRNQEKNLGVPLYDELDRKRRDLFGGTQKWKNEEWPPERIIEIYGLGTWAQDGSWWYQTPIYMLNHIIRLQAVPEIITNQTALGIDLIASQQKQMRAAIYQNRLTLDYLLAEDGGVCGKFNTSECCIEIDNNDHIIRNITSNIQKTARVPVQRWTPLIKTDWLENLLKGKFWKRALFLGLCTLAGLVFLLCALPCLI